MDIKARMEDLAIHALKAGIAVSRFLNPAEARTVTEYFKRRNDIVLGTDGGFIDAERKRAIFSNPDWGAYERNDILCALRVEYRKQDEINHRDILGALMGLGIERGTVGDIIADTNPAAIICIPGMCDCIISGLKQIGRVGVDISRISLEELPEKSEEAQIRTDTVMSARLDAVLASAFEISRRKAVELITSDCVNLDYTPCEVPSKICAEGSVISVRGFGRAKLLEIGGMSKKRRTFIRVGIFGK